MTPLETVQAYEKAGIRFVIWPENGDVKGPVEEGWTTKKYTAADWVDGYRIGLMLGHEIQPGHFLADIDIDWSGGQDLAAAILPPTYAFGRESKYLSHAFYTSPEPLASCKYVDTDRIVLMELRCAKSDGTVGNETMVPPSTWSKDGRREELVGTEFDGDLHHFQNSADLTKMCQLIATSMIFARAFGHHGFGHEPRLAWAGHMLRLNHFDDRALSLMGKVISQHCANTEMADIEVVLDTTRKNLAAGRQVTGGPVLARILGERGQAILNRINEWVGLEKDFITNKGGFPFDNQPNARRALHLLGVSVSYDEFAQQTMIIEQEAAPQRKSDSLINGLRFKIESNYKWMPAKDRFFDFIDFLGNENRYHPVKDYLNSLKWDGVKRVDTWLIDLAGAEDSEYVRAVSALFLIAAVRRVRQPGCKFDEMPILESQQGWGKSTAMRTLCGNDDWFTDDLPLNVDSKKVIEGTLGKWLVEHSDLAGKSKTEIESVKAFTSRGTDGPVRLAYDRESTFVPRQFVNVGTTNHDKYLIDPTGGRRFWPIACRKRFELEKLKAMRDQLWAEAAFRESEGESIRLAEHLWPLAAVVQESRQEENPWETVFEKLISTYTPGLGGKRRIPSRELWNAIDIPINRRDMRTARIIAEVMRKLGYKCAKMRITEGLVSCYEEILGQQPLE